MIIGPVDNRLSWEMFENATTAMITNGAITQTD